MSESKSNYSGGIGFSGMLAIVFIVLKLVKVIDWSWWWVLAPIWIGWGLAFFILGIIGVFVLWAKSR